MSTNQPIAATHQSALASRLAALAPHPGITAAPVPGASDLLRVLAQQASDTTIPERLSLLTAFTHPRRVQIVSALSGGQRTLETLRRRTAISTPALLRHLKKLTRRGLVRAHAQTYQLQTPGNPLAAVLLRLALN